MNKRILLVNNGYPDEKNKNNCTYIKSIYDCLTEENYEVEVLSLQNKDNKIIEYLKFYWKILIKRLDEFDLIYLNHWPFIFLPFIFKNISGKKVIINFHGSDLIATGFLKNILNKISYKFISGNFKIIAPSLYFKKILEQNFKNDIHIIPSGGVDMNKFYPNKTVDLDNKRFVFGFASGINLSKGIGLVLEVIKRLNNDGYGDKIQFNIIEYGNNIDLFKDTIKKNNIKDQIVLKKVYSKDNMNKFYNEIDCLLFPTMRSAESLGLVALEALACGVPVIGTNDFALPEFIIEGENGFLFDCNEIEEFVEKTKLIIDRKLDFEIAQNTSVNLISERYSKNSCINMYRQVIENMN